MTAPRAADGERRAVIVGSLVAAVAVVIVSVVALAPQPPSPHGGDHARIEEAYAAKHAGMRHFTRWREAPVGGDGEARRREHAAAREHLERAAELFEELVARHSHADPERPGVRRLDAGYELLEEHVRQTKELLGDLIEDARADASAGSDGSVK